MPVKIAEMPDFVAKLLLDHWEVLAAIWCLEAEDVGTWSDAPI